ncbi:hypothetical protein X777_04847, partial [Ooceraea biroi]
RKDTLVRNAKERYAQICKEGHSVVGVTSVAKSKGQSKTEDKGETSDGVNEERASTSVRRTKSCEKLREKSGETMERKRESFGDERGCAYPRRARDAKARGGEASCHRTATPTATIEADLSRSRKTEHLYDVRGIYGRTPNRLGRFGEITNTWRDVKRALSLLCVKKFSGSATMLEAPPGSREDLVEAARTPCTPTGK